MIMPVCGVVLRSEPCEVFLGGVCPAPARTPVPHSASSALNKDQQLQPVFADCQRPTRSNQVSLVTNPES